MSRVRRPAVRLRPRLRVELGHRHAIGPGKADLLVAIGRERSLTGAALSLGMSYMRAWRLVRDMNELFVRPLVELTPGARGGAVLTRDGERVLALYREMERGASAAMTEHWKKLRRLLRRS